MAKILILIGGHLCTAPRPQKEAEALASAGHEVSVRGIWFDPVLVNRDRLLMTGPKWQFRPILDFQPHQRWTNWRVRLQGRIERELYRKFHHFSPNLLGYGARAMLRTARQIKADLTIVHSESGLWVGNQLLNEGFQVGIDFEDWFSEDLLPEARSTRPISQLKQFESRLIQECRYCLTTSHAMAEAIAEAYQAPKPAVIYNSFPWAERSQMDRQTCDRKDRSIPSLHWFSQTIGPGRGLELLFAALPYLKISVEIHLRGNDSASSRQWLEPLIPNEWRDRIFIHKTVPNAKLLSRIAEHDVGLALESTEILSRNLTITNKLFQYLQAGLAVMVTDTAGQREIISKFPMIGQLIPHHSSEKLAQALEVLLSAPEKLLAAKAAALKAAESLSWEHQQLNLLNNFPKIFSVNRLI